MKLEYFLKSITDSYELNKRLANVEISQVDFKLANNSIYVLDAQKQQLIGEISILSEKETTPSQSWLTTSKKASSFFAEIQDKVIQTLKWGNRLSQALSYKKPVEQVLRVLQEKVSNPLLIFDSSLKLLGYSRKNESQLTDWKESIKAGYISVTMVANQELAKVIDSTEGISGQLCDLPGLRNPFYLQEIILRNDDHFYLIIPLEEHDKFQEDRAIVESVTDQIAATVGLHNFPYQSQGGNLEGLLRDILVRPNISINEIQNRLQFDPHQLKRPLSVLCIKTPQTNIQPLGTILTKFVTFHYDQYDIYVVENSTPVIVKTIIQELVPYLKRNSACAGLSNIFNRLHLFNQYYQQAIRAIKLGTNLEVNKYQDYIASDLIEHIRQDQSLTSYLSKNVMRLRDEDHKLFVTLKTFLVNRENKKQTALELNIHRSTLDYRLNKISEVYGIELLTSNQYLYVLLSTLFMGTSL